METTKLKSFINQINNGQLVNWIDCEYPLNEYHNFSHLVCLLPINEYVMSQVKSTIDNLFDGRMFLSKVSAVDDNINFIFKCKSNGLTKPSSNAIIVIVPIADATIRPFIQFHIPGTVVKRKFTSNDDLELIEMSYYFLEWLSSGRAAKQLTF